VIAESSSKTFCSGVSSNQTKMLYKRQITALATTSNYFDTQIAASAIAPRRYVLLNVSPKGGWEEDNLCCGEQDDDGT